MSSLRRLRVLAFLAVAITGLSTSAGAQPAPTTADMRSRALYTEEWTWRQRQFHDAILEIGSVPLPVLEARMKQFIADGGVSRSRILATR